MRWELTGKLLPDGRPIWVCNSCGKKIWGYNVAPHNCNQPKHCVYLLNVLTSYGCCGSPITTIYGCMKLTACTVETNDGTLEFQDKSVASCEGCKLRTTDSPSVPPQQSANQSIAE